MPKDTIWIERLFKRFPINEGSLAQQMLVRFSVLLLVWITGLVAYALDGLQASFVVNLQIYQGLFGTGLIVLLGTYKVQSSMHGNIISFRSLLEVDDSQFLKFRNRVGRYLYGLVPCFLIAITLTALWSRAPREVQMALIEGFRVHTIWDISFTFLVNLLSATGIWLGVSIWLTIYLISRQPLKVELSSTTVEKFRGLAVFALWFSLFYFLVIAIAMVIVSVGNPALSLVGIFVSPFIFFIAIGILSVLFPFYNIHRTLLNMKRRELLKIEEQIERLLTQLDEDLAGNPARRSSDQMTATLGRLFSLEIKERRMRMAPEWPIDMKFISKLIGLVLMPMMIRILIDIINRLFLRF